MLQKNVFSLILKRTTLSLSALLLGCTFATSTRAMDTEAETAHTGVAKPKETALKVFDLNTFKDFLEKPASSSPTPALKPGDLLLINVGHGLVQSCTSISERNTEAPLFAAHTKFLEIIKSSNETDHNALTKKAKLASGEELVKLAEKDLPTLLSKLSAAGVYIIPISSRGDDGKSNPEGKSEILSRTEKEFRALGYDWENWAKPASLKNLTTEVTLQDDNPAENGAYKLRNGVIYSTMGKKPHKSAAIVGLLNKLKEDNMLPSAIYFSDVVKTIKETSEDLKEVNLGIPIYLMNYTQPKPFITVEDLKEFYIHRLREKFQVYEAQFKEVFKQ